MDDSQQNTQDVMQPNPTPSVEPQVINPQGYSQPANNTMPPAQPVVSTPVYTSQPQPMAPASFPQPQAKKKFGLFKVVIIVVVLLIIAGGVWVVTQNKKANQTQNTAITNFTAESKVKFLQSPLESFYLVSKYYPSDITQATFDSLNIQVSQSVLTPPAGTKYVYTPAPAGCTTQAKNCTSYTLSAIDASTGTTITSVQSKAGQI